MMENMRPRYSVSLAAAGAIVMGLSLANIYSNSDVRAFDSMRRYHALRDSINAYGAEQVVRDPQLFRRVKGFVSERDSLEQSGVRNVAEDRDNSRFILTYYSGC